MWAGLQKGFVHMSKNFNAASFTGAFAFFGILLVIVSTVHGGFPGFMTGCWFAAFLLMIVPIMTGYWAYSAVLCFWWFIAFVGFMIFMGGWHHDNAERMWETIRWYFAWIDWALPMDAPKPTKAEKWNKFVNTLFISGGVIVFFLIIGYFKKKT